MQEIEADKPHNTDSSTPSTTKGFPWWREPLLHFFVLGIIVFGIEQAMPTKDDAQPVIKVDETITGELLLVFEQRNNRPPTDDEFAAMLTMWQEQELLYQEGLSLGLDKDDPVIRDRIISKMQFLIKKSQNLAEPDDEQLRAWYRKHRNNYTEPKRYDFEHLFIADISGETAERAHALLAALGDGSAPTELAAADDDGTTYHRFFARNEVSLRARYGDHFVETLQAGFNADSEEQPWQVVTSDRGTHIARVNKIDHGDAPSYESLRQRLLADWRRQQAREHASDVVDALRKKYDVRHSNS